VCKKVAVAYSEVQVLILHVASQTYPQGTWRHVIWPVYGR